MGRATAIDGLREHDLVAVVAPPGPAWLDLIRKVWAAGAALLPVDPRLPPSQVDSLLRLARPTVTISDPNDDGSARRIGGGVPASDAIVLVVHTSGTAGEPRLAQFERRAIEAAVSSSAEALGATPGDRWLCCLPLAHVGGLLVLLRGILLGAPVTILPRFDVASFADERDIEFASLVPTMLRRVLDAGVDLSTFRTILVGGAEVPAGLRARAGGTVVETYGLTESCGGVIYDGRPIGDVEVRLGAGDAIELAGPTLMSSYRSDARATAAAFTDDGWLATGDVGALDVDGRLRVLGRADDLITSGGEKVWPSAVEAAIVAHPKVRQVAAAGVSDPEWGQRVVVWVLPADPLDPPSLEELRRFAATTLAGHEAPRGLVLVDELPRTPSGKLRRSSLPQPTGSGPSTEPE